MRRGTRLNGISSKTVVEIKDVNHYLYVTDEALVVGKVRESLLEK